MNYRLPPDNVDAPALARPVGETRIPDPDSVPRLPQSIWNVERDVSSTRRGATGRVADSVGFLVVLLVGLVVVGVLAAAVIWVFNAAAGQL